MDAATTPRSRDAATTPRSRDAETTPRSRDARRRRIVERGSDRLALISGRIKTLPSEPESPGPGSDYPRGHMYTASCPPSMTHSQLSAVNAHSDSQVIEGNVEINPIVVVPAAASAGMPIMAPTIASLTTPCHLESLKKFGGLYFKRWQKKMLIYLTTLGLARMLFEEPPAMQEGENNHASVMALEAWKHFDYLCKNYILNSLENILYGFYCEYKTAKTLWHALEKKYKTEDAIAMKYLVGEFMDYKLVDSKTVVSQVEELRVLIFEMHEEGITLSESFQVAAVIGKLPPLWKEFKSYLKHKRKEMKMDDLIVRLRIEEDRKVSDRNVAQIGQDKANLVEAGPKAKKRKFSGEGSKNQNVVKKFNGNCLNCGKLGHRKSECCKPKNVLPQANMVEIVLTDGAQKTHLPAVVTECNDVGNPREWWVDIGVTRNVCAD